MNDETRRGSHFVKIWVDVGLGSWGCIGIEPYAFKLVSILNESCKQAIQDIFKDKGTGIYSYDNSCVFPFCRS